MGIKNLNGLIKPYCQLRDISQWRGTRIAIDTSNWLYAAVAVARSRAVKQSNRHMIGQLDHLEIQQTWLTSLKYFLIQWLRQGITPIFVFDGAPPKSKANERAKRMKSRQKVKDEISSLQAELDPLSPLDRDPEKVKRLKQLQSQITGLANDEIGTLKTVLKALGMPVLQATSEAEELCCLLCRTNQVAAVYSTDTDNLARGCPVVITGRDKSSKLFKTYYYPEIIRGLNVTESQFLEICIMAGCDYNNNIPGIGIKKSYNLIKLHQTIDQLPPRLDITCLNHQECRIQFRTRTVAEACDMPKFSLDVDTDAIQTSRDILSVFEIDWTRDFIYLFRDFKKVTDQVAQLTKQMANCRIIQPSNPARLKIRSTSIEVDDLFSYLQTEGYIGS